MDFETFAGVTCASKDKKLGYFLVYSMPLFGS